MAENPLTLQPGPVFYEVFQGCLRIMGTNLTEWAGERGYAGNNVKMAATGSWNGPAARALRQKMVEYVGVDTFTRLYRFRMEQEVRAEKGAA